MSSLSPLRRLTLWTTLLCAGCADREPASPALEESSAALLDDFSIEMPKAGEKAAIIVNLRLDESRAPASERQQAIEAVQEAVLSSQIAGFDVIRRYKHVAALAGRATSQAIVQLRTHPDVASVQPDGVGGGQLKEAVPAIGGDLVKNMLGLTGRGVRVAVLDTGVDTDHPDLKDALVAQHCFTQAACPPSRSFEGTSAEDDHGHGSNVAGIIASGGVVSSPGFAPDVELVAVKINNAQDSGQESDWVAGLDWVYDNLATLKVQVVNLSIGTTQMHTGGQAECDRAHPAMAAALKNLIDAGVTVFSASGNRGSANSMASPACNSGSIAVGAVYDSNSGRHPPGANTYFARWGAAFARCGDATSALDQVCCFTNSSPRLDLLAPGAPIISDSLRGLTEAYWGTSQAAPVAAGVAALMLQCNAKLTPAQIKDAMTTTGVRVTDPKNSLTFPSLRAFAAVTKACGLDAGVASTDAGTPVADAATPDSSVRDASTPPMVVDAGRLDAGASGSGGDIPSWPSSDASIQTVGFDAAVGTVVVADAAVVNTPAGQGGAGGEDEPGGCECAAVGAPKGHVPVTGLGLSSCFALGLIWRRRRRATAAASRPD